jgi:hypothetical protein
MVVSERVLSTVLSSMVSTAVLDLSVEFLGQLFVLIVTLSSCDDSSSNSKGSRKRNSDTNCSRDGSGCRNCIDDRNASGVVSTANSTNVISCGVGVNDETSVVEGCIADEVAAEISTETVDWSVDASICDTASNTARRSLSADVSLNIRDWVEIVIAR